MFQCAVPSTEGRPRGRATMGRDAVLAGGIRNPVLERNAGSERAAGKTGPTRPAAEKPVRGQIPRGAPRDETHRSQDASPGSALPGLPNAQFGRTCEGTQVTRLFGAPSPSLGGREKKRKFGRTPAPA